MRCWWLSLAALVSMGCGSTANTPGAGVDGGLTDSASGDVIALGSQDVSRGDASSARDAGSTADLPLSNVGNVCTRDDQCGGALSCDTDSPGGYCTGDCTDNPNQSAEQAQCGGRGATCLTYDEDPSTAEPFCARACDPNARTESAGACRAGYYCTGFWFWRASGEPDSPGCAAFCDADGQCPGSRCNTRTGYCAADGVVTTRRADGEPCDPTRTNENDESLDCRGFCIQSTDTRTHGVCASELNLRTTRTCPDNPTAIQPLAYYDENDRLLDGSGVCAWRSCATNSDCAAPLRCIDPGDGDAPYCDWPEAGTEVAADGGAPADASTRD